jgi:hypothetical protein
LDNDDLLRPTLSDYRQAPALYSSTGFFLSSFFGGPVGAAVYGLCNSYRLNRLATDLPVIIALAAAAFFLALVFLNGGQMAGIADLLGAPPRRTVEVVLRAFALACFGAIYLMHRRFFRTARVTGNKSLPSWIPGIAAVVLGYFANQAFIDQFVPHHANGTIEVHPKP